MKPALASLFHTPQTIDISGFSFLVSKLSFERFNDAFALGDAIRVLADGEFSAAKLGMLFGSDAPASDALARVVASCLQYVPKEAAGTTTPVQLAPADVAAMPLFMVMEAVAVVLQETADFFMQTLPKLGEAVGKLGSIGSSLLNSLLERATALGASAASASAS